MGSCTARGFELKALPTPHARPAAGVTSSDVTVCAQRSGTGTRGLRSSGFPAGIWDEGKWKGIEARDGDG